MITVCSLQFSHEFGLCKNNKHSNNFKQLDALSFRHLDSVNRPSLFLPSQYNVFVCRSSLVIPIRASEVPILKTAATALTRSYNAFHGNPFVVHLIPGFVIIAFAIWGLAPLVRHSRNMFFKSSDNSWKRSGAYFVTSSYIQPILLWTGVTLVCRAFDPVVLPSVASQSVKTRLLVFVRSISTVLALAYCLSSLTQQVQQYLLERSDSSNTGNMGFQFVDKAVHSAVWVAAVSLFMELLGFSTQKMLTAGGLGTVLLTLAGREIFTNFLSSLMIHATRPFVLNEWIQTKIEGYEVSGTVEHVGWWSPTIIRADDREAVHIPNHKFTVNIVRNLSQKTHWRIKTYFSISHLDVNKINLIVADMRKVLAKNPQVEQQKLHRRVFFERIDPENQALVILVSCFVKTSHIQEYFCVKEAVLLDLLRVISHHRARLATPIRTVQKMNSDEDMENIPFSETVFSSARAATNRPFLLIEPSYKINGDDKTRLRPRSAPSDEEQDTKITAATTDDSTTAMPLDSKEDSYAKDISLGYDTDDEVVIPYQSEFDDTTNATTPSPSDTKVKAATLSDVNRRMSKSMVDNEVTAPSLKSHGLHRKAASSISGSKVDPEPAGASQKKEPVNHGSESSRSEQQNKEPEVGPAVKTSTLSLERPQGSGAEKGDRFATSQAKQETEKSPFVPSPNSQSSLEDNIVLGVALDGSRRTLPIEDMDLTPPAEIKELEACGSSAAKNKSEDHTSAAPGDERDP